MPQSPPDTVTSLHADSWDWFTKVDWGSEISDATGLSGGLGVAGASSDWFTSAVSCSASVSPSGIEASDCTELRAFDIESCALNDIELSLLLLPSSPKYDVYLLFLMYFYFKNIHKLKYILTTRPKNEVEE